jgi:hypothetical protein
VPEEYEAYAGGLFDDVVSYENVVNFVGTCSDHVALEGDGAPDEPCSSAPLLCLLDPNCLAIRDCVAACAADEACTGRCLANGDDDAEKNLAASTKCAAAGSDSPALQRLFSAAPRDGG